MKIKYLLTVLFAIVLATGCSKSADEGITMTQAVTNEIGKTQEVTKDMAMDLKDYTFEKKTEFITSMRKQVAELDLKDTAGI